MDGVYFFRSGSFWYESYEIAPKKKVRVYVVRKQSGKLLCRCGQCRRIKSHPFMQRIMRLLKSFIVWICFIPVAILNGGLREYVLVKFIGEETALPVSGILLSVFIFLVTWLMLPVW